MCHVHIHFLCLPSLPAACLQMFARRRAARLCARTLLVRAWRSWQAFIPRSQEKRAMNAWMLHRRLAGLLRTCWSVWLQRASRARAVRVAAALARRRHASQLLRMWHEEARHSALLCQAVSGAFWSAAQAERGALHSMCGQGTPVSGTPEGVTAVQLLQSVQQPTLPQCSMTAAWHDP